MDAHSHTTTQQVMRQATPVACIGGVDDFCRQKLGDTTQAGLAGLINAAWATVIWQYTGLESVRFVTATPSPSSSSSSSSHGNDEEAATFQSCEVSVDGNVGVLDLIHRTQNATRDIELHLHPAPPSSRTTTTTTTSEDINTSLLQSMTVLASHRAYLEAHHTLRNVPAAQIELVVAASAAGGDLEAVVYHSPSALDSALADHLAAAFAHIVGSMVRARHDRDRLETLDLVSDHDKSTLWAWNRAQLPETVEQCVHVLFRRRAREAPDMPAVDAWDGRFTYAELDGVSDRIAAWLVREERVGPETIVPLCFEKSRWAIAALLAVIKAGGAIVFIDPANPVSRRRDILDQVGGRFVLASTTQAPTWEADMGVRTVIVNEQSVADMLQDHRHPEAVATAVTPDNLLYLIFTSGSTGRPKGCLIPHKAFVSGALQHAAKSNLSRGSRVLQLASYSFDVSMLEILTSLISGACVCTPDMSSLAHGLHPVVERFAVTWAFLTPSMVKLLRPELVPTLKTLALGGEPLHKVDIETWAPHLQLINGYGPSECSVAAAGDPHLRPTSDPSNIGRAVGGLCWIVDADNHDRLVPLGSVGELLISGPILARGYLNDPDKTAASFIQDPAWSRGWSLTATSSNDGGPMRLYKTGDLARFNLDGTIRLLGRKDTQVKLRGLRVELGEIEHNLAHHLHVKHVAAFLPKTGPCRDKIVAVVCLDDFAGRSKPGQADAPITVLFGDEKPEVQEQVDRVRKHLHKCVPEYMVPAVWITIEAWPLLLSGKLDRKRVAGWVSSIDQHLFDHVMGFLGHHNEASDASSDSERARPDLSEEEKEREEEEEEEKVKLSDTERALRQHFARALNTPARSVPLDKTFIALGGDSLAAMRVVSECNKAGLPVDLQDMLRSKGIAELASKIEPKPHASSSNGASFPLSRAQTLCLGALHGGKPLEASNHSESLLLSLDQTISSARLKAAIGAIVDRHSMLRGRFFWNKDQAADTVTYNQSILARVKGSYRYTEHAISRHEEMVDIRAASQAATGLAGPVFSADFIRTDGKQLLLLTAHRAVVDSASWIVITRDLDELLSLEDGLLPSEGTNRTMAFRTWVELETSSRERSEAQDGAKTAPITALTTPETILDYWGRAWDVPDGGGASDVIEHSIQIEEETSALLMGQRVHAALRTDTVDFLVASLLYSFGRVFTDHQDILPTFTIWEDQRQRASRDFSIDLSSTVGQFEVAQPLMVEAPGVKTKDELVDLLKRTKDGRRLAPDTASQAVVPISDISFQHLDLLSDVVERPDALVKRELGSALQFLAVSGKNAVLPRSPVSVRAQMVQGQVHLVFAYSRHVDKAAQIRAWIAATQVTLTSLVAKMTSAPVEYTLSDFPLLRPLSYDSLDALVTRRLPRHGLVPDAKKALSIEDIYPCSPMQRDLLLSQNRSGGDGMYEYHHVAELQSRDPQTPVDVDRLAQAWEQVVQKHASLRTIFVESEDDESLFDQVVLAQARPRVSIQDCSNSTDAVEFALLADQADRISFRGPQPPHRLTICRISGASNVVVKLEINHAIVDGASAAVMLRDILLAYDGRCAAQPTPAMSFRNYISYIRQAPEASSLDFWASYLKGLKGTMFPRLAALESPNGARAAAEKQLEVVQVPLESEGVTNQRLFRFCREASVTPASVFQAAWAMVLREYAESPDDVSFGYLSAGRDAPLPGIQDGVGAFLTMLVSRLRFAAAGSSSDKKLNGGGGSHGETSTRGGRTITTLLDAVRVTADDYLEALSHQHVGLSKIQHSLKTGGSSSSGPLFNTIVAFNRDAESPADSTLVFKSVGDHEPDEYGIVVDVQYSGPQSIRACLRHWTDHLTSEQARIVASALGKAVESIVCRPDTPIGEVSLVAQYHTDKLLSFNAHAIPRADRLIFTRFQEHARVRPEAQAICAWDGVWTYQQLDDASTRLAHFLRSVGVGPETVVPHCFHKSGWAVVTCLAITKAGGAFVGLDPTHPKQRLTGLVREAGAKVVCVAPQNLHLFENGERINLVVVTRELVDQLPSRSGQPCPWIRSDNAACVVFTSGTTGRPKAVVVEHASMATLSDVMGPAVHIGPDARVFQFASYTFDTSNQDIFTTLQRGGCVCVPSEDDRINDPAGAMQRLRANHAHLTSTVISLMRPETVPGLRWLFSAGEPLTRENVEAWAPAVELYNSYGPAESSVAVTCTAAQLAVHDSPSNIGRPYGCRAWIVDAADHHKLVPLGVVGELLITGPLLARHYLNDVQRTAAAFIEDPKWAKGLTQGRDRRFYRTGDLCRFNSDGTLTIVGRRDTQIKIHGQRVELDHIKYEVQAHLSRRGVQSFVSIDALRLPGTQQTKEKKLVAFVQFLDRQSDDDGPPALVPSSLAVPMDDLVSGDFFDLQRALKATLPSYMVPAVYVPIKSTPRTASGKLARNVLRETVAGLSDAQLDRYMLRSVTHRAVETPSEKMLQAIWSKILSVPLDKVGADDDFFQLGGDSVTAMRLTAAARAENMSLTVADIFASPVLSDMARIMRAADETRQDDESDEPFNLVRLSSSPSSVPTTSELEKMRIEAATQCGVRPDAIVDLYPCTPLQEGLIALSMRQTGAYKDQRVFRLADSSYDVSACRDAIDAVVAAEAILRTRFVSLDTAGMLQAVLDQPVEWVQGDDLAAYLRQDLDSPVVYGCSLLRLALIEEHDGSRFVVWSGHHALCDGFSMDITFEQIAHAMSHAGSVVPKPVPFKNFIRYLDDQARDSSAHNFWQGQFPATGAAAPQFPAVTPGHHVAPHHTCKLQFQVVRAAGSKVSVSNYLRAAWGLVVARHLDSSDVLFGSTLSGRNAPVHGISTMNGPTMATVPFRMKVPFDTEQTTVAQYLQDTEAQAVAMMPFEHTGLQNIRRINEQARASIDNMTHRFAVELNIDEHHKSLLGLEVVSAELPGGFYTDPLVVRNFARDDGTVDVEAKFDYTLISDAEMRRLLQQYVHVAQQLLQHEPGLLLRDVQLLSPEDIGEILNWNGDLPDAVEECVHHLIEKQTRERPDAEAVCAWDGTLTFAELDCVTERLASHLQTLGVGPEVTVALCFDKSKWNVVSMLSVLKAGGCYTSLSPAYPAARMRDILQDVEAPLVLSSPQHAGALTGVASSVLSIDDAFLDSLLAPARRVASAVQPSNMAFIVFTSGSTGKPKGAIIEHRGICSMQHFEGPHVSMGPDTRTLQFASHVFDVANSEIFTTLMRGGCVCVPSEAERINDLAGAINKYRVNWSFLVPTMADSLDPDEVPGLGHLALGGEAIRQGLCDRWADRVTLLNSYGPSECSIWTSVSRLPPGTTTPDNIGRGLGCRTWVVDQHDHDRLVAIGCVGELCVEGPIVTRGYKARPLQTAAAYIANPSFARSLDIQVTRMYKTGDLVKYAFDGTLLYVGRRDSQVKIRGQRIELGEVEHNIISNDIEADAVVVEKILQGGDADRVALAAFFKLGHKTSLSDSSDLSHEREDEAGNSPLALVNDDAIRAQLVSLRRKLLDSIPPHMVPSYFISLRNIPVTQTGKKDRKALRALGASLTQDQLRQFALDDADASVAADEGGRECVSDAEKRLRSLWAEVLGIRDERTISANDSFFLKGGDSIQAMRLAAAARRVGRTLAVADMFRMPRLHQMATMWEQNGVNDRHDNIAPFSLLNPNAIGDLIRDAARQCNVQEDKVEDIYLCSPLQEGLMAVSTRKPGSYVSTRMFDLPAALDMERFKESWQKAADVFPILRTRVVLGHKSESYQVVLREQLVWDDMAGDSAESFLAHRGLPSIEYGGRLCAFALDVKSRKFVLALHHALYDGWSATMLLGAVEKMYNGETCTVGPSFNVFIRHLSQIDKTASDSFWREQLSGAPAHFPRLPNKTYEPKNRASVTHTIRLPAPDHQKTAILRSTLLRAAWAMVSARHAESDDITFGAAQSGRDCAVPGIEEIAGPIVTTVPVRVRLDNKETVASLLKRIQDQSVAMIAYQHAGVQSLRQLGKDVQPALEFTTLLEIGESSAQDGFIAEIQRPELLDGFWSYPIIMECHLAQDGITLDIVARHDPVVVATHEMDWICKQFEHVVGQLYNAMSGDATGPARLVGDIDIFGPDDMAMVETWNARWPVGPTDGKTVHEAISEQARLNPTNLALAGWDGEMTYAQLEHYATKLAKALVAKQGVGPEVMVPLCFDKSKWAVVASVAVIKAGGVVVHLGPTHPTHRRNEILSTIDATFVLVSPQHVSLFEDSTVSTMPIDQESLDQIPDADAQLPHVKSSNSVYLCFTSGSTGRPKGIMVEHGNLRMSALAHGSHFGIQAGTRVFQFSAYTFDIGLGDIFISLQRGATICTPSEWERLNELAGAINKYEANFLSVTPSVAKLVTPESVPKLRTLVLGGEAPTQDNIKTWSDQLNLIIIWGPAETTIYASATPPATQQTSAQGLGNPMGSVMWLCDPNDHDRLVPLGCVGEIVVEGPLVSRGYIKDDTKTAAAYITSPAWAASHEQGTAPRRMYKTGDLARYDSDGYMLFSGRKDNQVKLHGQRMELEEIEKAMLAHEPVRQAVARIPRHGPFKDKLVAMMSLRNSTSPNLPVTDQVVLLSTSTGDTKVSQEMTVAVRHLLEDRLPTYMVPSVFICVESVPLSNNSKIDRKMVDSWLGEVDQQTYESLLRGGEQEAEAIRLPSTEMEKVLCNVIGEILGSDPVSIGVNRSFLNLGGDSVSAMQLRGKARAEGVLVSMQDIIKSQSLVELASKSVFVESRTTDSSSSDSTSSFVLSPIQKMYFDLVGRASNANVGHFDQSVLLQINQALAPRRLHKALKEVVQRHSMLRARYAQRADGEWYQYLAKDATDSFHFSSHDVKDGFEVATILKSLGAIFDIRKGPVFSAHVFNLASEKKQLIFVRAHHLVVDVVSWHVLLGDLETFIVTGNFASPPALSFPTWLRMQSDMAQSLRPADLLPFALNEMPAPDFEFWGMNGGELNIYGDAITSDFYLDETTTTRLMTSSNSALKTAPVDIILAALFQSFAIVFPDRATPAIFSEGHGRESWSDGIDPSSTVGWFTTMSPLHVPVDRSDITSTLQTVKDLRRRLRANGMPYFSSRYMSSGGREAFASHMDMEIMFNYLGRSSQVGGENALFSSVELPDGSTFDELVQDEKLPRWSLFDIVALIEGDRAHVTISYNKTMKHQDRIAAWIATVRSTLVQTVQVLANMGDPPTKGSSNPSTTDKQSVFGGINSAEVEEKTHCVPVQQHMLAAREKHPDRQLYEMEFGYVIKPTEGSVDVDKLREAWQTVVRRHAALRTVLAPSTSFSAPYDQVVLKDFLISVPIIECTDEEQMQKRLAASRSVDYSLSNQKPHHQLTLFTTNKHGVELVACKIEIDHAITDGVSMALILHDLVLAYDGQLSSGPAPSFGDYTSWLDSMTQQDSLAEDMAYWKDFDRSAGASRIPQDATILAPASLAAPNSTLPPRVSKTKTINLAQATTDRLPAFCSKHGVTMAAFFQTAWGLVLRELTGSDKTVFAFMTANRDAQVTGAGQIVGPLINMLLCRIDLSQEGEAIGDVLRRTRDDFLDSLDHQYGLAKMGDMWDNPSWNSLMSMQYMDSRLGERAASSQGSISLDMFSARDPTAWDISIGLQVRSDGQGATVVDAELGYWSDFLSDERAQDVKTLFEASVVKLLSAT